MFERSKKVVFISECLLNQNIRAYGVRNGRGEGPVKEIIDLLADYGVGIDVVHCPEIEYEGLNRTACGKKRYDNYNYREICSNFAEKLKSKIIQYSDDGYSILGFIGVNGSPSCGVDNSYGYNRRSNEPGIFIETVQEYLDKNNLDLKFVGADMVNIEPTLDRIKKMLGVDINEDM